MLVVHHAMELICAALGGHVETGNPGIVRCVIRRRNLNLLIETDVIGVVAVAIVFNPVKAHGELARSLT